MQAFDLEITIWILNRYVFLWACWPMVLEDWNSLQDDTLSCYMSNFYKFLQNGVYNMEISKNIISSMKLVSVG